MIPFHFARTLRKGKGDVIQLSLLPDQRFTLNIAGRINNAPGMNVRRGSIIVLDTLVSIPTFIKLSGVSGNIPLARLLVKPRTNADVEAVTTLLANTIK
jgi:hypothetical protein